MKNIIYKGVFLLSVLFLVTSCEQNEIPQIDANGPTLAQFSSTSAVLATPEEGASTQVEVVLTTKSSTDRVINFEVDPSSTATSDQYTVGQLIVPANSYIGTLDVSGNFNALPESGSRNLILNLTGVDGNSDIFLANSTLNIEFFRKCAIVLEDFVGTWSGTGSWSESDGYTTEVVTTIDENGDLYINGLAFQWFTGWWGEVIVTNDPVKLNVDEETGALTIDEQFYITSSYNGAVQDPYNLKATGMVLNSCNKTIQIYPVFVQGGNAIDGTAWGDRFVETITLDQ